MKTTTLYDFTLTANGAQSILADANFYKVLTATGDISVTRDGGATIKPLRAGRGERNVPFQRLVIRDLSGAPNSGTILVGDSDFIDDTIVISSAINTRPESSSGTFSTVAASAAGTPVTALAPASNTGGLIVQAAYISDYQPSSGAIAWIAHTALPSAVTDGEIVLSAETKAAPAGAYTGAQLSAPIFISSGKGLYLYPTVAGTASYLKSIRWKLL